MPVKWVGLVGVANGCLERASISGSSSIEMTVLCVCVCVCVCVCMCVCVCVRERERERESQKSQRQTDRNTHTEKERERNVCAVDSLRSGSSTCQGCTAIGHLSVFSFSLVSSLFPGSRR